MGVKEDLRDTRPYWKVLVSLVFSLTATLLFICGNQSNLLFYAVCNRMDPVSDRRPAGDISGKEIKDYETIGLGNYHYSGTCVVHRSDLSDYQPDMGRNFGIDPQFSKHVS